VFALIGLVSFWIDTALAGGCSSSWALVAATIYFRLRPGA
jgi:hypothetical protein